jgi:hypothetical protein
MYCNHRLTLRALLAAALTIAASRRVAGRARGQ